VCRDGACAPECTEDAHCAGEALCVDLACVAPECETFADCEAGESCVDLQCVERACGDITFTYDPQGTAYDQVYVAGAFTDWEAGAVAMEWLEGEGHWHTRLQIDNGAHQYKFILETGGARDWITDPSNPDTAPDGFGGNNSVLTVACDDPGPGPSACGDVEAFDWRDAVMYFAMVDRFHDGDGQRDPVHGVTDGPGDGSSGQYMGGDLPGLTAKIPYLQSLGVTAIWITAPYENRDIAGAAIDPNGDPHTYSGYHGYWPSPDDVDYSDLDNPQPRPRVESRIGTDADLHAFVDAAHAAGIKVLFDYVMNHVDVESGLYRAHSDPANGNDWFARRDGNFALCGPDNLWDDLFWGTRCAFTSYLPPFDFDNAAARAWSINDAVWWAKEYDIDGYRLDAIKHVSLQWLQELRGALSAQFPEPAGDRFYLVGETFAYDDQNLIRSFVDPDTMLDGQFDFPFKARVCEAVLQPGGRLDNFAGWMGGNDTFYGPGALMTTWIGNHDIPRAIHFASGQIGNCREGSSTGNGWAAASFPQPNDALAYERMALVYAIMMTNPGIPLIYYGDEVGLGGGGDPDNRRMMPWDDNALNAHQHALRAKVAKLGQIRTAHPVLGRGTRTNLQQDHDQGRFWVYRMRGCGDASPDITVAINKSDGPVTVDIPQGAYVDLMNDAAVQGGQMQLEARDFVVLQAAE
jgi:glycosidase